MTGNVKRDRLIDSAAALFHKHGMVSTSLADIAKHAEIPIGNVYYYFKTKDELALAALDKRRTMLRDVYEHLEASYSDPRERLVEVVRFFDKVKEEYTKYGCPIYRMITDGGDADKEVVAKAAADIYYSFVEWAENQFKLLGHTDQAHQYATSLLAGIQGGAVMAKAFGHSQIMADEFARLTEWISSLPNKKIFLGKAGFRGTQQNAA